MAEDEIVEKGAKSGVKGQGPLRPGQRPLRWATLTDYRTSLDTSNADAISGVARVAAESVCFSRQVHVLPVFAALHRSVRDLREE